MNSRHRCLDGSQFQSHVEVFIKLVVITEAVIQHTHQIVQVLYVYDCIHVIQKRCMGIHSS